MSDKPSYNVSDILRHNTDNKSIIGDIILDIKHLSEEFADHKVTGEYVINLLSAIVVDLEEVHDDMIVQEDE